MELNPLDRISLLPDCLLIEILSFLDSKSVVQTCVLSKRWKNLWIDTHTLNFDFKSCTIQEPTPNFKECTVKRFILRFLSQHRRHCIKKLSLSCTDHETDDATLIVEFLLCYARHRTVQELCLNTFNALYIDWPLGLSTCSSLTVLKMKRFMYEREGSYTPSLKTVEVEYFYFEELEPFPRDDTFSNCPNLESLVLVNYGYDSSVISAPKLENLELFSKWEFNFPELELHAPSLKSVKFTNILPTVESASEISCIDLVYISVDDSDFGGNDSDIQNLKLSISQLLQVFRNARSFTLPLEAMEMLVSDPSSLSEVCFHNLRYLKLETKATNQMTNLYIGLLMNSFNCPKLEELEVFHYQE